VLGLVIGVPVAAALAYILFGPGGPDDQGAKKAKKAKAAAATGSSPEGKKEAKLVAGKKKQEQVVEVEDCPEEEPTDPLQRALAAKVRGTVVPNTEQLIAALCQRSGWAYSAVCVHSYPTTHTRN
jgi:hypothetical protein